MRVSGVRSSWEALAANWRWASKAACSRSEQAVDGVAEVFELVAGAGHGQPRMQVVFGDRPGGGGHLPQRAQHPACHQPAQRDGDDGHDGQRDRRLSQQLVQLGRMLGRGLSSQSAQVR